MNPLDDPVGASLRGPHAHLADRDGDACRYPTDVSPFAAPPTTPAEWDDLARLVGPDGTAVFTGQRLEHPADWEQVWELPGVQLVDDGILARPDPTAELLTTDDVPEMLDLVGRTRPGPFLPRTIAMGRYLGIRDQGTLVAMAGERMRPPGWTEISAVCTDPAHRGRGLGSRLILAIAAGIQERGSEVFLHTSADNATAIHLYGTLGFRLRTSTSFVTLRAPGNITAPTSTEQGGHPAPSST